MPGIFLICVVELAFDCNFSHSALSIGEMDERLVAVNRAHDIQTGATLLIFVDQITTALVCHIVVNDCRGLRRL